MRLEAVLVDLDDTLYPERAYFESGLVAVADWVAGYVGRPVLDELRDDVRRHGRDGFLDRIQPPAGETELGWRRTLLHVYRNHQPSLRMFAGAAEFLGAIRRAGLLVGVVTDGKSVVQRRKVEGLRLLDHVDLVVCTDDIDAPKPSPEAFEVAATLLGVAPDACAYVADDPSKDFIGPKKLGMLTVRVDHGPAWPLARRCPFDGADAEHSTTSLPDALRLLLDG